MSTPTADQFVEFYESVYGYEPFPWQKRLAKRACDPGQGWPSVIALPTAAGKTTCIDIAVFALACQPDLGAKRTAPRRVFFVVDRRIVVDQARDHAADLSAALDLAPSGILRDVADRLRELGNPGWLRLPQTERDRLLAIRRTIVNECDPKKRAKLWDKVNASEYEWIESRPLDAYVLRGGMYRETAWARTPLQPTIIASTVDQVGSRLLFRGYGVSDGLKPIHAGLVGNDSLILLDEAHCARPFSQTAGAVERYRGWHDDDSPRSPFAFVTMTATPSADVPDTEIERDEEDDRTHKVLGPRITASKPTKFVVAEKATGRRGRGELVKVLAAQARELMADGVRAVGVIVNRVATARELARSLESKEADVILLTGRMRPIDRDGILKRLEPLFSKPRGALSKPTFVVATQCLEVGADLDFHALVSECASLDALRQRFGRLNRVAARDTAKGVIVIRGDETEDTADDPVYGASLAETWKWLRGDPTREEVDFGIAAMRSLCAGLSDDDYRRLNAPAPDAPVLLPAHIDCWVQTCPIPVPDPKPAVFLHGLESGVPDVQVVFRDDLGTDADKWRDIVALCPPSSSEALPVRIDVFRKWLAAETLEDKSGDVEGEAITPTDDELEPITRRALRWRGPKAKETKPVFDPEREVTPGDTFVVSTTAAGVEELGDFPTPLPTDCGEEAYQRSRDKAILRFPELELDPDDEEFEAQLTAAIEARLSDEAPEWLVRAVDHLKEQKNRKVLTYPEPSKGYVVVGRKRLFQFDPTFLEDDESSESPSGRAVTLDEHSRGVAAHARRFAAGCSLPAEIVDRFARGGRWHDLGKLDPRFQAMLQGRSPRTIRRPPWAKSENGGATLWERRMARAVHRYPAGGRHELLSVALARTRMNDDLLLHLIATHHGCARPFALPVEENDEARPVAGEVLGESFALPSSAQTVAAWNCELPERFWRVVRRFGWWGSAYLEAIFRLADQTQSRLEQEQDATAADDTPATVIPSSARGPDLRPIPLVGLDGSNPLAFLAAIGLLRTLSQKAEGWVPRLGWKALACWVPEIWVPSDISEAALCEAVADQLATMRGHPALRFGHLELDNLVVQLEKYAKVCRDAAATASRRDRIWADFCAAFGSDVIPSENDPASMQDTAFRTMSGSGHQDFLAFFRNIVGATEAAHLEKALLQPWRYDDPLRNMTTRWDPLDDVRYALRWKNPSSENTLRSRSGSVLGANRLAIEALPLFPSVPVGKRLMTTGFIGRRSSNTFFTWPIWGAAHSMEVVRTLLALEEIQTPVSHQPDRGRLAAFNILEVFRSQRITVGKYRNFTPAQAV